MNIRKAFTAVLQVLALLGAQAAHAGQKDIVFLAEPLFGNGLASGGSQPILLTLQNSGESANGTIRITNPSGQVRQIPVSLPKGSNKEIVTSGFLGYGQSIDLVTDQGVFQAPEFNRITGSGRNHALLVGGHPGDLSFLKLKAFESQWSDLYIKPEKLPIRAADYDLVNVIILGEGAERMSDAAASALQLAVLSGKNIVIMGGASSPILSDKRWGPLVGEGTFTPRVMPLSSMGQFGALPDPVTVSAGRPSGKVSWSSGGVPILTEQPFGLGRITFLAFDLFESAGKKYTSKFALFTSFRDSETVDNGYPYMAEGTAVLDKLRGPQQGTRWGGPQEPDSVFQVKPPSLSTVAGFLALYFVIVLPLNFFLLARMKRQQLAWITIPVISLGFSALIFKQAAALYGQGLETAKEFYVVGDTRSPLVIVAGRQQLFTPRGGQLDLKIPQLDQIETNNEDMYGYGYGRSAQSVRNSMTILETDTQRVSLEATNLSFHDFNMVQSMRTGPLIKMTWSNRGGMWSGDLENLSNWSMNTLFLDFGGKTAILPNVAAHAKVHFNAKASGAPGAIDMDPKLSATMENCPVGAPIGHEARNDVRLVYRVEGPKP